MTSTRTARFATVFVGALAGGLASGFGAAGALAAEEPAEGRVFSLSPEDKAKLEAEAYDREMRAAGLADDDGKRRAHGEASIMVGTGGALGLSTSVVAPVGENATVGVAFAYERNMYRYDPYYGYGYGGYGYGGYGYPYGYRGTYGASDYFGHLDRVERMERWQGR